MRCLLSSFHPPSPLRNSSTFPNPLSLLALSLLVRTFPLGLFLLQVRHEALAMLEKLTAAVLLLERPLKVSSKVDLAMWGHHHSYQRTCAVEAEVCKPGAPVHLVCVSVC